MPRGWRATGGSAHERRAAAVGDVDRLARPARAAWRGQQVTQPLASAGRRAGRRRPTPATRTSRHRLAHQTSATTTQASAVAPGIDEQLRGRPGPGLPEQQGGGERGRARRSPPRRSSRAGSRAVAPEHQPHSRSARRPAASAIRIGGLRSRAARSASPRAPWRATAARARASACSSRPRQCGQASAKAPASSRAGQRRRRPSRAGQPRGRQPGQQRRRSRRPPTIADSQTGDKASQTGAPVGLRGEDQEAERAAAGER